MLATKRRNRRYYANTVDNLIPEIWANESLLILEEEMVMGNLVHRDFSPVLATYGETVHTRKPSEFTAKRKTNADNVTDQDVSTTGVDVKLNQHVHTSFVIKDGEQTLAFKNLVDYYLHPAMLANARFLDQVLCGQSVQFLANARGGLGQMSSTTARNDIVDIMQLFNTNKVYAQGRNLVLSASAHADMMKTDLFVKANELADGGRAMREAYLGRKFGFNTFMDINVPLVAGASYDTAVTAAAAVAAGATTVTFSDTIALGQYFTAVGDYTPLQAKTVTNSTSAHSCTTTRATYKAIANSAAIQLCSQGAVDLSAGYASGYVKEIHVDGGPVPKVGQLVSFVDTSGGVLRTNATGAYPEYVIIQVTNTSGNDYDILLDRPLESALDNDDVVNYGPNGEFNFAFHRNALALVNRPLALPISGTGARSAFATYNNMSMRVVITYDGQAQGHRVTLDGLFGVAVLDTALGGVLLG